eukprot:7816356-Pyramimonas_sp.AAC.1
MEGFARIVLLTVCMVTYGGIVVFCRVGVRGAIVQVGADEHASTIRQMRDDVVEIAEHCVDDDFVL